MHGFRFLCKILGFCARFEVSVQETTPRVQNSMADFSSHLSRGGPRQICNTALIGANLAFSLGASLRDVGFCARFEVSVQDFRFLCKIQGFRARNQTLITKFNGRPLLALVDGRASQDLQPFAHQNHSCIFFWDFLARCKFLCKF